MEISVMITELKNESVSIARTLRVRQDEANTLRDRLHTLDAEIQSMTDRYDALKMAIDSLELVHPVPAFVAKTETPDPAPATVTVPVVSEKKVGNGHHSRVGIRIGKYDPKGKKIGEYCSINRAAKLYGWSNAAMKKYIKETTKEKQIKLRGYYLEFIAA